MQNVALTKSVRSDRRELFLRTSKMHSLCVFTSARETAPAAIITAGSLFSASLVVVGSFAREPKEHTTTRDARV